LNVKRGDLIGLSGNSGTSSGPHLHYQVDLYGNHQNPMHFFTDDLSQEDYLKMITVLSSARNCGRNSVFSFIFSQIGYLCHIMPRTRYKFNPESLSFDKYGLGFRDVILRFFAYFVGSVIIALIYWLILAVFIDSPKEKALKREIEQLTIQYDLMNKEMDNLDKILGHLKETDDNLYGPSSRQNPSLQLSGKAG